MPFRSHSRPACSSPGAAADHRPLTNELTTGVGVRLTRLRSTQSRARGSCSDPRRPVTGLLSRDHEFSDTPHGLFLPFPTPAGISLPLLLDPRHEHRCSTPVFSARFLTACQQTPVQSSAAGGGSKFPQEGETHTSVCCRFPGRADGECGPAQLPLPAMQSGTPTHRAKAVGSP